jgi:3-hydroxyisobutyrate dehydrogenase-like beta-hydroxyacid dehydrogenase
MRYGLIGLGKMGLAMAGRLISQGHEVIGYDIEPARMSLGVAKGVRSVSKPVETVTGAECVLSVISDDAAARGLFQTSNGLLAGGASGRLFVEMSTLQPATVRDIGRLAAMAGARFVAAPVMGTIPQAEEGRLLALASGAPEDVAQARPALQPLARAVRNLGPLGSGNAMKLVVNLGMAAFLESLTEGFALGARHGLSVETMLDVLAEAPIASPWLKVKADIFTGKAGPVSLDIRSLNKDVMSAVAAGAAEGVPMPMASGILAILSAAVAGGRGDDDLAELPRVFRETMLRRPSSFAFQAETGQ